MLVEREDCIQQNGWPRRKPTSERQPFSVIDFAFALSGEESSAIKQQADTGNKGNRPAELGDPRESKRSLAEGFCRLSFWGLLRNGKELQSLWETAAGGKGETIQRERDSNQTCFYGRCSGYRHCGHRFWGPNEQLFGKPKCQSTCAIPYCSSS